jgi:hypothetical protein
MSKNSIVLDWARLLGFNQADPANLEPDRTPEAGGKSVATLRAKVGEKNPPGVVGRPQQLRIARN